LEEHFERMRNSAKHFRFAFDKKIKINTTNTNDGIARLLLDKIGNISV
jgi:branched-subunit amino acid aminotransferase/4-amino-4-deoxychorismate lyase